MRKIILILCMLLTCFSACAYAEIYKNEDDVSNYLTCCYEAASNSFSFDTDESLYETLVEEEWCVLETLLRNSGISGYSVYASGTSEAICFEFTDVQYFAAPFYVCESESELHNTLSAVAREHPQSFSLLLSEELYNKFAANDFSLLKEAEAAYDIESNGFCYSDTGYYIEYTNPVYRGGLTKYNTLNEIYAYTNHCALEEKDSIEWYCTGTLYSTIVNNTDALTGTKWLDNLTSNCGIYHFSYSRDELLGTINLHDIVYYPGFKIANAYKTGDTSRLTDREKLAYVEAMALANACMTKEELQTAKNIHDAICNRVIYETKAGQTENDTAVGALLNGRADCDGYSDAFYAVASIAGLKVCYQFGFADGEGSGIKDGSHIWNLIYIDGSWRAIDVTWDDSGDEIRDTYFNIGEDVLSRTHDWNRETAITLAPTVK